MKSYPKYSVSLLHAKGSRITNKIIKALKSSGFFKITYSKSQGGGEDEPYLVFVSFTSEEQNKRGLGFLQNEIIAAIPELFPVNYFFAFCDEFKDAPLGWKFEFRMIALDDRQVCVYTKIKEQKPDSIAVNEYRILTGLR